MRQQACTQRQNLAALARKRTAAGAPADVTPQVSHAASRVLTGSLGSDVCNVNPITRLLLEADPYPRLDVAVGVLNRQVIGEA